MLATVHVTLVLLAGVASLSVLSCGGGGGGSSGKPRDEVIITPPGHNRAPVIERTVDGISLTLVAATTVQWESADIDTYFSDPDNDALGYEATSSNTGVADTVFSQSESTLIVRAAGAGTATVTVTATDPEGLSATQSFTVTVFPADHSDTDAGASEIIAGQTVEGYINSPDDVDYFLFRVSEPGVYEIVLESDLPGLEISLQDENGHTLAVDQTESPATIVVALKVAVLHIVIRCSINPICVAVLVEAFTAASVPEQSNAVTVAKFVVAVVKRLTSLGPEWVRAGNVLCHVHLTSAWVLGLTQGYSYEGDCGSTSLIAHGVGAAYGIDGNRYIGQWQNGSATGQGRRLYVYDCEYEDAFLQIGYSCRSVLYVGNFLEGRLHGRGTSMNQTNGVFYEGTWQKGEWHGQGTATTTRRVSVGFGSSYLAEYRFEGEWRNNSFWNGTATEKRGESGRETVVSWSDGYCEGVRPPPPDVCDPFDVPSQ